VLIGAAEGGMASVIAGVVVALTADEKSGFDKEEAEETVLKGLLAVTTVEAMIVESSVDVVLLEDSEGDCIELSLMVTKVLVVGISIVLLLVSICSEEVGIVLEVTID
jgi:hypothetical protein